MHIAIAILCLAAVVFGAHKSVNKTPSNDEFTYTIINNVVDPMFNHSMSFTIEEGKTMIQYMKAAVMSSNPDFTSFTANFTSLGYLMVGINGVTVDYKFDKSYWLFKNATSDLSEGVSTYKPHAEENVILMYARDS